MIATVDKNEDWKISYSEFRVKHQILKTLFVFFAFTDMYVQRLLKYFLDS